MVGRSTAQNAKFVRRKEQANLLHYPATCELSLRRQFYYALFMHYCIILSFRKKQRNPLIED